MEAARSTLTSVERLGPVEEAIAAKREGALAREELERAQVATTRAEQEREAAEKAAAEAATKQREEEADAARAAALVRTPAQSEAILRWLSRARQADEAGQPRQAIAQLEACVRRFRDEPDCHQLLGDLYVKVGSSERDRAAAARGLQHYRTFLKVAPRNHEAYARTKGTVAEYEAQKRGLR